MSTSETGINGYLAMGADGRMHIGENDDGLHCGECLEVFDAHSMEWKQTRIEYSARGWYLVGIDREAVGCYVRQQL